MACICTPSNKANHRARYQFSMTRNQAAPMNSKLNFPPSSTMWSAVLGVCYKGTLKVNDATTMQETVLNESCPPQCGQIVHNICGPDTSFQGHVTWVMPCCVVSWHFFSAAIKRTEKGTWLVQRLSQSLSALVLSPFVLLLISAMSGHL